MPGISEQNDEPQQNSSEAGSTESVRDESSAAVVDNENAVPPVEVNQTDKINKFLLKSFLERMNTETLAANDVNDDSTENFDEREWQWNVGRTRNTVKVKSKLN